MAYEGTKPCLGQGRVLDTKYKLNTGNEMPIIGFGTYCIQGYQLIYDVLDAALKFGYRSFDTATSYGNEEDIGKALKELLPKYSLKREDIFITSKLSPKDQGSNRVYSAVTSSLNRLGVSYIDLYLIHWPGASSVSVDSKDNKKLRAESWKGLEDMMKAGKLKAIGVSNYTSRHVEELLKLSEIPPAVNQVEFHIHYRQTPDLAKICAKHGILLQGYMTMGGGKDTVSVLNEPTVQQVAKAVGKTPAQVVLRWSLQQGYGIIPKSVNPKRIEENAQLDFQLSDIQMNSLNNVSTRQKYAWNPDTVV